MLVQREAVERPADPHGERALQVGLGCGERRAVARRGPRELHTGAPGPGRGTGGLGAGDEHHARVTARDARGGGVERADGGLAAHRMHPAAVRRHVEVEARRHQRTKIVVGPRTDGHELERVDLSQHAAAGIRVRGTRGVDHERERFRIAHVVVVTARDLAHADDDRH
jgi:hypothetical protein